MQILVATCIWAFCRPCDSHDCPIDPRVRHLISSHSMFASLLSLNPVRTLETLSSRRPFLYTPLLQPLALIYRQLTLLSGYHRQSKIQYECDNGGFLYGAVSSDYSNGVIPSFPTGVCRFGVGGLYTAIVIGLCIDLAFQVGVVQIYSPCVHKLNRRVFFVAVSDVYELEVYEAVGKVCEHGWAFCWRCAKKSDFFWNRTDNSFVGQDTTKHEPLSPQHDPKITKDTNPLVPPTCTKITKDTNPIRPARYLMLFTFPYLLSS